ncbi:MAG: response regulator transcription factor [Chloracidobacterium sp.]|uniref:Response regulator transcription factor n=1 Tax=Chloracidobacterium validum TaxID=2821543 RepID=A0ABX8B967_9BACT|nr:response regulator transcription factor [Chloracidobacterium validum]QUW02601.1 response regulator transcription factor [Chloracidobacterium validum]
MAHILIVEDEAALRDFIREALMEQGHTTVAVSDGIEAMVRLRDAELSQPFQLIICDINLPGLPGWSVCDLVRLDPRLAHIPFLFLSGLGEIEQRLDGIARGANDYLAKPFSLNELLERITWLLSQAAQASDIEVAPNPLEQQTLTDLLRDIVHNARNGTLHFLLGDGSQGHIAFREGKSAVVVGDGSAPLEDQLRRLFTGHARSFHFA